MITLDTVGEWILNAMKGFPSQYKADDWIVTLLVDGEKINELLLFEEFDNPCSYVWRNDWYEGQEDITLLALCPISLIEPQYFVE